MSQDRLLLVKSRDSPREGFPDLFGEAWLRDECAAALFSGQQTVLDEVIYGAPQSLLSVSGMSQWQVILWGSIMQGVYMVVYPALVQPFMRKVTGGDQVALGHTGNTGIALSGLVATLTRGKGTSKSTEDLNFPKGLGFLRDTTVVIALSMAVIYLIVGLFAGPTYI